MAYWDTSCVLRLYVPEPDSPIYVTRAASSSGPLYSSVLIQTELYYGLRRKEVAGDIKRNAAEPLFEEFFKDCQQGRFVLIPLGDHIQELARNILKTCLNQTAPIFLRSLDGLHLASALASRQTAIVTTDQRMMQAAAALGLKT